MKRLFLLVPVLVLAVTLTLLIRGRTQATPEIAPLETAPRETAAVPHAPTSEPATDLTSAGAPTPGQLANGARTYRTLCVSCHLPDGRGVAGVIPPLVASDFLLQGRERAIRVVLRGLSGPIVVNTAAYNNVMPPLEAVLSDRQVADVLTYVFNSWGNSGDAFDPARVATIRVLNP